MDTFKYCPHCQSKNFEFPNHRRFECFDCGFVFYENVAAAVALILEKDGKILFTVRNKAPKKGLLGLPGGFVDPDETAEEACSRELKEEINLDIAPADFSYFESQPNDYEFGGFPYKTEDLIFTATFPKKADFKLQKEEIHDIQWIKKSELDLDKIAFKSLRKGISDYTQSNKRWKNWNPKSISIS